MSAFGPFSDLMQCQPLRRCWGVSGHRGFMSTGPRLGIATNRERRPARAHCISCLAKPDTVKPGWDLGGAPKSDAINTASTPAQSKYLPNMIPNSIYRTSVEARRGDQDRELVELELFFETRPRALQPAILREVSQLFRGHRALEPGLRHVLQMV